MQETNMPRLQRTWRNESAAPLNLPRYFAAIHFFSRPRPDRVELHGKDCGLQVRGFCVAQLGSSAFYSPASEATTSASFCGTSMGTGRPASASLRTLPSYSLCSSSIFAEGHFSRITCNMRCFTCEDTVCPMTATSNLWVAHAFSRLRSSSTPMTLCPALSRINCRVCIKTGSMPVQRTNAIGTPLSHRWEPRIRVVGCNSSSLGKGIWRSRFSFYIRLSCFHVGRHRMRPNAGQSGRRNGAPTS